MTLTAIVEVISPTGRLPDAGTIELTNLVSLCRPHHRVVHEQGWRIQITDGIAVVERPP